MTQDKTHATLLVELGTEELPPKALKSLGLAFRDGIVAGLDERELASGAVRWFASPRRLAVLVEQAQLQGADKAVEVLGPPADRARDATGAWSPAAAGFARGDTSHAADRAAAAPTRAAAGSPASASRASLRRAAGAPFGLRPAAARRTSRAA